MNNPIMNLMQMLKGGANPKNILMNIMQSKTNNNPMINNLISMANQGNTKGVETFARNLFKEKGLNFDKEFNEFMGQFKNS